MNATVVVSQMGARRHYAVPRIFHSRGRLERLYTDICAVKGWPRLLSLAPRSFLPASMRRLAGRIPVGIPREKITTFDAEGVASVMERMCMRSKSAGTAAMIRAAERLSRQVVRHGFGNAVGFYGISAECVEQMEAARQRGLWTAVDQMIAPRLVVEELVAREAERFPEWEGKPEIDRYAALFAAREKAEWAAADVVICPSEFVRDTVAASGGPVEKCVVVPYGVDTSFRVAKRAVGYGPLRVLTVGAIGLRKGSPYVLEAARRLGRRADFRMVGPLPVAEEPRRALAETLDLRGQVPRAEIKEHFAWADVFLLPSICEGSAGVIYEALAAGIPAVTTANAGSIVRHGVDGFIVPVGDVDAIVHALDALDRDRDLLAAMGQSARQAEGNDIDSYAGRLIAAIENVETRKGIKPTLEHDPSASRWQVPHASDVVGA